jgi:hypothetical protein
MDDRVEIPPEHTALKSLEQSFREVGEERRRTHRSDRRRRRLRSVLATVAGVALTSGSVVVAKKVLFDDDLSMWVDRPAVEVAPDRRPALAIAADPVDRYAWGVRISYTRAGDTCAIAGRLLQGRLGVMQNGSFHELAAGTPGQCIDMAAEHAIVAVRNYGVGAGVARTVVYGMVDRTVTGVGIGRTAPGRQIPIADDGTFVYAVRGARALDGQQAFVTGADGVRSRTLGRGGAGRPG